jgi:phosphatidylserine/phosphatidylglycerophosphate/cardiolipin synthase-like enzyme
MANTPLYDIHFGGPDLPPCRLRDLLAERVAAVPAGGKINWVTYYFRDRQLAEELLRAHRRGVKVTVTMEGNPRTPWANDAVIAMLNGPEGLNKGFRKVSLPGLKLPSGKRWKPHLHEKLYCFSHPRPVAYIGSFNPSGDSPEEQPDVIQAIGDQDRGHNVLVGLYDTALVNCLVAHAHGLNLARHVLLRRFLPLSNRMCKGQDTQIHFWPRVRSHPVMKFFSRIAPQTHMRIAASHIKGKSVARTIISLARRGATLEILAEPTLRRVPAAIERMLTDAGISFRRIKHSDGVPMHHKFVLVQKNGQQWVVFGSFNWTTRSYWLNHEIGAISSNPELYKAFSERWESLKAQADAIKC